MDALLGTAAEEKQQQRRQQFGSPSKTYFRSICEVQARSVSIANSSPVNSRSVDLTTTCQYVIRSIIGFNASGETPADDDRRAAAAPQWWSLSAISGSMRRSGRGRDIYERQLEVEYRHA